MSTSLRSNIIGKCILITGELINLPNGYAYQEETFLHLEHLFKTVPHLSNNYKFIYDKKNFLYGIIVIEIESSSINKNINSPDCIIFEKLDEDIPDLRSNESLESTEADFLKDILDYNDVEYFRMEINYD